MDTGLPASLTARMTQVRDRVAAAIDATLDAQPAGELTDAMRALLLAEAAKGRSLEEVASTLEVDHIADHLYTAGQPDPDLIIRTSGEIRLSGFMLWQSVYSEYYFCDVYWPGFRRVDFLRALREYSARNRRFGQ